MLTVLLATKDRAAILREVLESYCRIHAPSSGWKLVIVDNGSTDETVEILGSFSDRLPLQFLVEPQPGKNYALNAGLEQLEGDLAVFTDDDAFPHVDWLVQLRRAADEHPEYTLFGGAIVPRWEVPPPSWINWLDLGPIFTVTEPDLQEGELPPISVPMVQGPNMAIRSSIFQSGTRFNTSIGPSGKSYAMGSETELLMRLSREGYKAWHVQGAIVEHFVRESQLDREWILQRAIRWGRGRFRMAHSPKLWFGVPRHLFRDMPKEALVMAGALVSFRRAALFRSRWRFNILRGVAIEARKVGRETLA